MPTARRNSNRARCQFAECDKFAQTRGLCKAHGGGSRCRDPTCNKLAQSRGLCIAHGGGRRCQYDDCAKLAQSKGYCISHGGGRRCTIPNCEKFSQVKGRCKSHSKLPLCSPLTEEISEALKHQRLRAAVGSPTEVSHLMMGTPRSATKLSIDFLVNPAASQGTMASDYYRSSSAESDHSSNGSMDDVISGFQRFSRISPRETNEFRSVGSFGTSGLQQDQSNAFPVPRRSLISFLDTNSPPNSTPLPSIASLTS
ncbi:hypothetical protein Gpo141_00009242 [Globisporangium polare]